MNHLSIDNLLIKANTFSKKGHYNKAIEIYQIILNRYPQNLRARTGLNISTDKKNSQKINIQNLPQETLDELVILYNQEQFSVVVEHATVLTKQYSNIYLLWHILGASHAKTGNINKAILSFQNVLLIKPDFAEAHKNLGLTLLNTGQSIDSNRIKEGLDEYEWRWKTDNFLSSHRHFPQPLWDGQTSLKGKRILIWYEQGIGDTMNWSSCLSLVVAQAQHVILECQEKLVPLLSRSFPNVEVKAEDRSFDTKRDDFDLHLPMGSLYKHFIDDVLDNKKTEAYLVPDPDRVKYWKERLNSVGEGPYVGISWKSSVKSAYRLEHYPSISEWAPVLNVPNVTFINLQYVDYVEDIARVEDEFGVKIHNFDDIDQYGDIDEVAALCAALDVVVSTKVTPPMISAGVGTPTKIANWRQSIFNNILNNPNITSFEMFDRDTGQSWDNVFETIADKISISNN